MEEQQYYLSKEFYDVFINTLIQMKDKIAPEDFHYLKHKARITYDNWKRDRGNRDN